MMARNRGDIDHAPMQDANRGSRPSALEWVIVVFALIMQQQGAFVSVPLLMSGDSLRSIENPFNTAGIAISMASIGVLCAVRIHRIWFVASRNVFSVLFMVIVLLSAIWSIHPDLTVRRGIGYVLTMLLAGYLVGRFDVADMMKVLSWSFAMSAIGSLLFVAAFPQYGIMNVGDLAGAWRGVFPHKEALGAVMAVAVLTELYLLVSFHGRPRWRWVLLCTFLALVVLSRAATAWLLSLLYLAGTGLYLLWKRKRLAGIVAAINAALLALTALLVFWNDPTSALASIGKDVTLTGRTTLWDLVISHIHQRPVLGWGYRAMWQVDDPTTAFIDRLTGNWGVTSSHNGFLEVTLQLGLVGMGLMLAIVGIALWRGYRCCRTEILPLGWFSLVFFLGAILAAQTMETLGQNQVIEWVIFNVLSFSCGLALVSQKHAGFADGVPAPPVFKQRPGRAAPTRKFAG